MRVDHAATLLAPIQAMTRLPAHPGPSTAGGRRPSSVESTIASSGAPFGER